MEKKKMEDKKKEQERLKQEELKRKEQERKQQEEQRKQEEKSKQQKTAVYDEPPQGEEDGSSENDNVYDQIDEEDDQYENTGAVPGANGHGGGICAIALYDYQAMADDEISFDPNDIIT